MQNWLANRLPQATSKSGLITGLWSGTAVYIPFWFASHVLEASNENAVVLVVAIAALLPVFVFVFGAPPRKQQSWSVDLEANLFYMWESSKRLMFWFAGATVSSLFWSACLEISFSS